MENVVLVNLSRQMAMRRTMDVIANNLANMNTTAFKAETMLFQEHAETVRPPEGDRETIRFVMDYGLTRNLEEGQMQTTGNPLDLAISGEGFFAVQTPGGERYTRNGNLSIDTEGRLTTKEGHPILDQDGREIFLDPEQDTLTINSDGSINVAPDVDPLRLMIVRFEEPRALKKAGGSLFTTDEAPKVAEEARIVQGMLEKSNVSAITEMTRMIQTMRAYESASKASERSHDLTVKAIERLGRTQA